MIIRITFTFVILFNAYLFATIGDTTRADIIVQAELIPSRIGKVIEVVGVAIQERANHNMEVGSL